MKGSASKSDKGRLLAVGDIHGCLDHLVRLMDKVRPSERDQLVFLGDYVDRGPDSRGVLDYLIEFERHFPQTVFLKGNHEKMFLDFLDERNQLVFLLNGGDATLENYEEGGGFHIPRSHLQFLEDLELYYETERFIFVHAGLRPGLAVEEQREEDLLWIRDEFVRTKYSWGKVVVFGHTPLKKILFKKNKIGLDTGAVYGRVLTCCDVEEGRCWMS